MVVFLVSAQERRIGSWWTWCAWRTVSSLSIGTSFRTKPREPPRKAGFRCSETSSLTNEQTAPVPVHEKKGCRRAVPQELGKQGLQGTEVRRPRQIHSAHPHAEDGLPVVCNDGAWGFCRHVVALLLRSLSPQPAVDSGNSPVTARLQGHIRSAPRSVRFSWPSGVWRQFGDVRGSSLNSSEIGMLAVAHGNRTHRGRLSAPATGFEDRASHQIRKRYHAVLTLKLGQTDNILWVWCRAGAIELHQPGVGELVRAPFLRRQVRVALRHLDGRVPHPDPHLAKVVSGRHAVRRERVAQHVPPLASGEGADLFRRDGERTAAALRLLLAARPPDEGADRGQLLVLEVGGAALVVQYEL